MGQVRELGDDEEIIAAERIGVHDKVAKLFGLSHDVMRHTFISFFVAKYRSMGEAALQAGNSEAIIRKHYLDLKTPAEAEEFFGVVPKRLGADAPFLKIEAARACAA